MPVAASTDHTFVPLLTLLNDCLHLHAALVERRATAQDLHAFRDHYRREIRAIYTCRRRSESTRWMSHHLRLAVDQLMRWEESARPCG